MEFKKQLQQTQQTSSPVEQINENAVAGCLIAKDELSIEELTFDTEEKKCRGRTVGSQKKRICGAPYIPPLQNYENKTNIAKVKLLLHLLVNNDKNTMYMNLT
ncbi:uncharacterized protein LOC116416685 [Nasonia vitripennis]|uniref:Uncharacterized protein n=1 Tax=Nasonia vitripennis TaxID=7425 RepID=A0A7M7Q4W4_NASVI|nr:uncharacterized protein LOC116416685 [Nasonia vitripennis]